MKSAPKILLVGSLLLGGLLGLASSPAAHQPSPGALALEGLFVPAGHLQKARLAPADMADPVPPVPDRPSTHRRLPPEWDGLMPPPRESLRVSLDVLVNGRPLPTVWYGGKTYLPVPQLGTEYELRVCNHGPYRITALVSVDGLSVINGEPTSEMQPGYIVAPNRHILIRGWRRDLESVAAFRFEERDKSYASLMGRPENIGVINLTAIEELVLRPRPLEAEQLKGANAKRAHAELGGTGTGYGRDLDSPVYYVTFLRSANKRTLTLHYDTVDALRKAGMPVDTRFAVPPPDDPRR